MNSKLFGRFVSAAKWCGVFGLFCCLTLAAAAADASSPNRYLFIVDTSASMQPRAPGIRQMVAQLLMSDLNGNLRQGDTLGFWTFNEQLDAGQFPWQVWSPERRQTVAVRVTEFLDKQSFDQQTDFHQALTQMFQGIKNSDNLTVILFSDGIGEMRGTPFDDEINAVYREQHRKMQKARMPFVTVLRAQGGKIVNHSVNFAPWPIDIPAILTTFESARIAATKSLPTNPPPAAFSAATSNKVAVPTEKKVASAAETNNDKPATPENAPSKATAPAPENTKKAIEPPSVKPEVPSVATPKPPAPVPVPTVVAEAPRKEPAGPPPSPKPSPPPAAAPKPDVSTSANALTVPKAETPAAPVPQTGTKPLIATAESKTEKPITEPTVLAPAAPTADQSKNVDAKVASIAVGTIYPASPHTTQKTAWLMAGLFFLLIALYFSLWRLAGRNARRSLLPATVSNAETARSIIVCPNCDEHITVLSDATGTLQPMLPAGSTNEYWQPESGEELKPGDLGATSLRARLVPHLARLMMHKLVRALIFQRRDLLETHRQAATQVNQLEERLTKLPPQLQSRIKAYERRIAELEKELSDKAEENRELIRAQIVRVKRELEAEKPRNRLKWN